MIGLRALFLALLMTLTAFAAPAPLPRRESRDLAHPTSLCGVWRLGWTCWPNRPRCEQNQYHAELRSDGTYRSGYASSGRILWVGTWRVEGADIVIRERLADGLVMWVTVRVPICGEDGRISSGTFAGTTVWLQRPPAE